MVSLIKSQPDQRKETNNNGAKHSGRDPRRHRSAPGHTDDEECAPGKKEEETEPIELSQQLASRLTMLELLLGPGGRVVEEPEQNKIYGLESDHDVVANAPVVRVLDDDPDCDELGSDELMGGLTTSRGA